MDPRVSDLETTMNQDMRRLAPSGSCGTPGLSEGRRAFTIVEMLVVLAVMATLAGMIVFAMGPLQDRFAVSGGASLFQTWLNTARQRAIRDKLPAGVRFLTGTTLPAPENVNPVYVTQMVYLEGGNEIYGTLYTNPPPSTPTNPPTTTFTCTLGSSSSATWPTNVVPNDILVVNEGLPHPIAGFPGGNTLTDHAAFSLPDPGKVRPSRFGSKCTPVTVSERHRRH